MSQMAQQTQPTPMSATDVQEKAREKGAELRQQASERLRMEVEAKKAAAGQQLQSLAETVRTSAAQAQSRGQQGQSSVLEQVAVRVEQISEYLNGADPDQLREDATTYGSRALGFAKQRPWVLAPLGIAVGFAASRLRGRDSGS